MAERVSCPGCTIEGHIILIFPFVHEPVEGLEASLTTFMATRVYFGWANFAASAATTCIAPLHGQSAFVMNMAINGRTSLTLRTGCSNTATFALKARAYMRTPSLADSSHTSCADADTFVRTSISSGLLRKMKFSLVCSIDRNKHIRRCLRSNKTSAGVTQRRPLRSPQ